TATLTSLSPTSGAVSASVTITGTNFGATQGTSTVTFNGVEATPTSWSATSVTVPVPSGATTGNVVVTVGGVESNGVMFTVLPTATPTITPIGNLTTVIGTPAVLLVSASVPNGNPLQYAAAGLPHGMSIYSLSGEISGTPSVA